jgi:hypothetical protein
MMRNNISEQMLKSAEIYSKAAYILYQSRNIDMMMLLPSNVNASLALEFYFKTIFQEVFSKEYLDNKNRRSHDFYEIYLQLPDDMKQKMIQKFQELMRMRNMIDVIQLEKKANITIPRDFEKNIEDWSSVFVKMRYYYEKRNEQISMMFFPEIEIVLKDIINDF